MKPATLLVATISLIVAACGDTTGNEAATTTTPQATTVAATATTESAARVELEAARAKWEAAGLDTYSYNFIDACAECSDAQQAPRAFAVWDGQVLDPAAITPTVEEIFDEIEGAYEAGLSVNVTYDAELGVPLEVEIDIESRPVNGGTRWTIEELKPDLPGDPAALAEVEAAWDLWRTTRPSAYGYIVAIFCDCPLEGSLYITVTGDEVTDWEVLFVSSNDVNVTPLTIDDLFSDLVDLVSAGEEGLEEAGIRIQGSARYHSDLGYPEWVGIDLSIIDEQLVGIHDLELPERVVFTISDLDALSGVAPEPAADAADELGEARRRWQERWFGSYTYELTVHDLATAEIKGPYLVLVLGGEVESATVANEPVDLGTIPAFTIDQLFDLVARQIAEEGEAGVLYDEELGYPVLVAYGTEGEALAVANVQSYR